MSVVNRFIDDPRLYYFRPTSIDVKVTMAPDGCHISRYITLRSAWLSVYYILNFQKVTTDFQSVDGRPYLSYYIMSPIPGLQLLIFSLICKLHLNTTYFNGEYIIMRKSFCRRRLHPIKETCDQQWV